MNRLGEFLRIECRFDRNEQAENLLDILLQFFKQ